MFTQTFLPKKKNLALMGHERLVQTLKSSKRTFSSFTLQPKSNTHYVHF